MQPALGGAGHLGDLVARIRASSPAVTASAPAGDTATIDVATRWQGEEAVVTVRNRGSAPMALSEVVLFDLEHGLPAETAYYGEGLQMLAQYGGSLVAPVDYGEYPDRSHYRLPEPEGFRRVYSMALLEPSDAPQVLLGFTSCRRFVGAFDLSPTRLRCTIDLEGTVIPAGTELALEGLLVREGSDRAQLLGDLAARLARAHPRTAWPAPPTGWCSWYCFGPRVTAQDVLSNLAAINRDYRDLEFVQIDDGYQPTMGDWLDTGPGFGGRPVQEILREIRAQGREPAIWVAPFVASPDSKLLREHPSWFVRGDDGKPMPSDRVMFGGWRLGPWFVLDGTNPEVQAHFEQLFATMRREWGVRYFKLDAIFWGMMHGGQRSDRAATRVEAYRLGMQAIRRGAGADAYILGCNHPIWPSLGLIDGSRSSLDIERRWHSVSRTGRENLLRAWQNGTLWWNDPDAFVQTGLPDNEARFHATLIHATGGAALSGDDLPQVPAARTGVMRLLSRPTGVAARFADLSLSVGTMPLAGGAVRHALFNWSDAPVERTIALPERSRVRDLLTGEDLGVHEGRLTRALGARDAALLESTPAPDAR
ncbi:MAG: alpha-galactosidase [Planctomycetaceae bacterium]|nr:alpha-galactosidase [Planctomycetaceae bacterium]